MRNPFPRRQRLRGSLRLLVAMPQTPAAARVALRYLARQAACDDAAFLMIVVMMKLAFYSRCVR